MLKKIKKQSLFNGLIELVFLPQAKYCTLKRKDTNRCRQQQNHAVMNQADTLGKLCLCAVVSITAGPGVAASGKEKNYLAYMKKSSNISLYLTHLKYILLLYFLFCYLCSLYKN